MRPSVTSTGKNFSPAEGIAAQKLSKKFLPRTRVPWCFLFAQPRNLRTAGDAVMTKIAQLLLLAVLALAFFFSAPHTGSALAQTTISGEWKASVGSDKTGDW